MSTKKYFDIGHKQRTWEGAFQKLLKMNICSVSKQTITIQNISHFRGIPPLLKNIFKEYFVASVRCTINEVFHEGFLQ